MCGRYTLRTPLTVLAKAFDFRPLEPLAGQRQLRFNIAPTQPVAAVRAGAAPHTRELAWLTWGLVPAWADDPTVGSQMINARAETVASKPSFRDAFRHRRCLLLADGFYEWKRGASPKQPYYIHMQDDRPFAFAGIWDRWQKGEQAIESCSIITTTANAVLAPLHERMPVILDPAHFDAWLDPQLEDPQALAPLLAPHAPEAMVAWPVSSLVNSPRNDAPQCIERAIPDKVQGTLF